VLTNMADRINHGHYMSLSAGTSLLALDAYATAAATQTAKLSITEVRRDKSLQPLKLPEGLFPQTQFGPLASALRFGNDSPLNAYYSVEQSGFDHRLPTEKISSGMEVLREYTDDQGHALLPMNMPQAKMGQEIDVHLKFRGLGDRSYGSIALVDLLPGGFELVIPRQTAATPYESSSPDEDDEDGAHQQTAYVGWQCQFCIGGVHASLQYADMREDRVVFYASLNKDVQEIVYRIKATNVGIFTTPPAYGEAMYDRSKQARSTGGKIEVVAP
jgi:alpha-2-macroglobulin